MNAIRAKVRGGRIEVDGPLDLPDGTEVLVFPAAGHTADAGAPTGTGDDNDADDEDDGWDNSPEGIAAWLRWYDSLEPLIFTPEERAAWEADRAARKSWELGHAEERAAKLQRLWE